ncbi:MAG: ABC transporter ATP-binding protein [bacterium TMED88]|nr:ABC transporter ATP-binding protein [Deltaproteobacteria bacterium]OUV23590.1 MAG: ABC transporter ATP-binding protein [bacterium TMED88]
MSLVRFESLTLAFGQAPLLEEAEFQIDPGERVCLLGRNGAGKSTLLKLIQGEIEPELGEVWRKPGLTMSCLAQDLPAAEEATVYDVVAEGLAEVGRLVAEYHAVSLAVAEDESQLARLEKLQGRIDAADGWSASERIDNILDRLDLEANTRIGTLSGGWRRRVALAQALVSQPDLLLLDEPTNHLDLDLIEWLEGQLLELRCGVLFVTHDRALMKRLATRIVDLDRGRLTSWPGLYADYLVKKAAALEEEARHAAVFDKKLAQEEVWIRQGIKARRTRNEGRVRALKRLRKERAERREVEGRARIQLDEGRASGKLVIEAEGLGYRWSESETPVVQDFSIRIMRKDRIGIIGPNGSGKTTLLQLLLGQLEPTEGSVRLGTKLEIAYFDQLRDALDPDKTLVETLGAGREFVEVQGKDRHVISYLRDFLFSPARSNMPVRALSGGEKNRLLLARLFAQPANLLVLDEPTNDLDVETLELLEELLVDYPGTILLVSHDRAFIDNVVTSTFVFEGEGQIEEYVGGYSDWLARRNRLVESRAAPEAPSTEPTQTRSKPKRLGFNEARELEALPAKIESLEEENTALLAEISETTFYSRSAEDQEKVHGRISELTGQLEAAYARWDELEKLGGSAD